MSGHRCWHNLISGKIEQTDVDHNSGKFRFASLPFESEEAPRGMKDRKIHGLFLARPQKVPHVCKEIVSTKHDRALVVCCSVRGLEPLEVLQSSSPGR